ncbi:MAG TPA: MMPL family transporter [Dongiaceae bacterium]|nr:MMPL family transporter [Dongiaceae bacterium]
MSQTINAGMLARILVRYRYLLAFFSLGIVLFSMFGLPKVRYTSEINSFFAPDDPKSLAFAQLEQDYSALENILVYVLDFGDGGALTPDALAQLKQSTQWVKQAPYATGVLSLANSQYTYSQDEELVVDHLFDDPARLSAEEFKRRAEHARNDPFLKGRLVSSDGRIAAIYSEIAWPGEHEFDELKMVIESADAIKRKIEAENPGVTVYLVGDVILQNSMLDLSLQSLTRLYPIIMLLGMFIIWYQLRSIPLIIAGFTVVFTATIFTVGASGWLSIVFNQTSVLAVIMVFVVITAGMVHINSNVLDFLSEGDDKLVALEKSLQMNLYPIFLTNLTTVLGFLCLNTCVSPPLVQLGNLSSVGIGVATIFTFLLMPAAITLMPIRNTVQHPPLRDFMGSIARFVIRHRDRIIWSSVTFTLACLLLIPLNEVHDDPISYFQKDEPFRQAIDFSAEHLADRQQIVFSLDVGNEETINDPAFLQQLDNFASWLQQQPEVSSVVGYHDLIKTLNKTLHDDDPSWYRIPDDRELTAQYFLLYEMSLPSLQSLNQLLSKKRTAVRVNVTTKPLKGEALLVLEEKSRQWLAQNLPNAKITATSIDLMFAHLSNDIVMSMGAGDILSVLLISLVLLVGIRSLKYSLITLIPSAFPAAIVYGLWGLFVGEVNMAVAVTFSMSLGIIVDDTIHVMTKYWHSVRDGMTPEDAIVSTFRSAGPSLVVTTAVVASGLLVLTQSSYGVHATMGWVTAPIIILALLFDLFLMPAIFLKVDGGKGPQAREPQRQPGAVPTPNAASPLPSEEAA